MPPQAETPLPVRKGEQIAGKYAVERVLGRGGMGFVVAARHKDLGHLVAIKMLLPELTGRRDIVERFLLEARAAVQLKSEHAVRVMDVGLHVSRASATSTPEEIPLLVMEYLEGTSLGSLARKGPLPIRDACLFLVQACDALAEAHGLGIVHRDLKPDNLFLTSRANGAPLVKVLDFGISRVPSDNDDRRLTGTTDVMGTPHYMAPEQMAAARNADARSDVWALGVTLFEMLTGRLPFSGTNVPEIITRVLTTVPPGPRALRPEIPQELDALVMGCLEKAPERRCPSAADLARALAPFAPGGTWAESSAPLRLPTNEDATTLYRVAPAGPQAPQGLRASSMASSGETVPAAPLGATAAPLPTGAQGPVTLDATTQIVRRKRRWSAVAIGGGVLVAALVALVVWSRFGANSGSNAAAAIGEGPAIAVISTSLAASTGGPTSEPPATNPPASSSGSAIVSPLSPSGDATGSGAQPVRSVTSKGAPTGTSGLKKTRK